MTSTIHTRIKQRREELGLSMKDLAEKVGVAAWQTVQQWEREDGTAPKRERLEAVARALQTTPMALAFGLKSRTEDCSQKPFGSGEESESGAVPTETDVFTAEAINVAAAFDKLNSAQRDAVVAQLRAFGAWF